MSKPSILKDVDEAVEHIEAIWGSPDTIYEKKLSITKHIIQDLLTQLEKEVEGRKTKCEELKDSEYSSESPDYFRGKIAILDDIISLIKKYKEGK
jgi:hypothetical protein